MFENTRDADQAYNDLTGMGFTRNEIGVMARQNILKDARGQGLNVGTSTGVGAAGGATAGGIAGLLVGLGALIIPGVGPVIAAGTWATAIGTTAAGAGLGAIAGGIVGALTGAGLSHDEAHVYAEGVKRGNILVTVKADDHQVGQVSDTLRRDNAVDVNTRRQEWQQQGWRQFDEQTMPDDAAPNARTATASANDATAMDTRTPSADRQTANRDQAYNATTAERPLDDNAPGANNP
jgi:hypothetical protein